MFEFKLCMKLQAQESISWFATPNFQILFTIVDMGFNIISLILLGAGWTISCLPVADPESR